MVRLGQGAFRDGRLDPAAIQRTLQAFRRFARLSEEFKVTKTVAFGTSALRDVSDQQKFLDLVREETKIELRVITGEEEAKLIAQGIIANERRIKRIKGKYALIDIGGGSTEVSICRGREALQSHSLDLGTARLQQLFLRESPPNPKSVEELRKYVRRALLSESLASQWPTLKTVIGSSGTVKAMAKILSHNQIKSLSSFRLELKKIQDLNRRMIEMNTSELLGLEGMESRRVDMILAGSLLLEESLKVLGAKEAWISEFSLRDGILLEEKSLARLGGNSALELHWSDLYSKAELFGGNREQLESVVRLGKQVFEQLRSVHRIPNRYLPIFKSALILRDIGERISYTDHEAHASYILGHTDLPSMSDLELDQIRFLVEHHEEKKPEFKKYDLLKRSAEEKRQCMRLLAVLRLVDALDGGAGSSPSVSRIEIGKSSRGGQPVVLVLKSQGLNGLEELQVEKKKVLFEQTFMRPLEVRIAGKRSPRNSKAPLRPSKK